MNVYKLHTIHIRQYLYPLLQHRVYDYVQVQLLDLRLNLLLRPQSFSQISIFLIPSLYN